nr:transcriptional regulator PpsR [Paracraurococcus ruber]
MITAAADIAIIIDSAGAVRDVAFNSESLAQELAGQDSWLGRPWTDTVAPDSRPKVEALLADPGEAAARPWRHVNLLSARGASVPVLFSAVRLSKGGRAVAFGRDLRQLSALQQRLLEAQQSLDRDYSRLRSAETRYRLLFQLWSDPVLILDAAAQKVTETNQAADALLGRTPRRPQGRELLDIFAAKGRESVEMLLAGVRATGRADEVRVLLEDGKDIVVHASPFRQENAAYILVRLAIPNADANAIVLPKAKSKLLKLVENVPDAFVVTGPDGRIMTANAAFLDMAQLANEEQALGEPLERWLGQPGVELEVLTASLRQRGPVRLFSTSVRGEFGAVTEVEISAVSVMNGVGPCYGYAIRDVGPRVAPPMRPGTGRAPRSVEQLTELIGQVPLKDLVREATDVIERLCIEAALELTGDNRASAAEMLGLSRQSLYVKLRRYGLGDLPADGPE